MPSYFVCQPNGKLAVFSTVVDRFTAVDLSDDEALAWCRGKGMSDPEAAAKVQRGRDDDTSFVFAHNRPCCDQKPLRRWHDALNTILHAHGTKALADFLAENKHTYADAPTPETP